MMKSQIPEGIFQEDKILFENLAELESERNAEILEQKKRDLQAEIIEIMAKFLGDFQEKKYLELVNGIKKVKFCENAVQHINSKINL